ncbi:hypothetical protein M440DRAFT_133449 [Trichoderma longibrachiatum ATCC 18648]|uniref:Uncharacterized protein n=1 Tax=Trichoderma longibrachiatum ATCC 18648 TaxID=983965 RepID=A0A2T4BW62_TRILO|nr:hypothetical protein M440DRAFT_133449 [Trichoderma longibrachiatum ATCC 18648]
MASDCNGNISSESRRFDSVPGEQFSPEKSYVFFAFFVRRNLPSLYLFINLDCTSTIVVIVFRFLLLSLQSQPESFSLYNCSPWVLLYGIACSSVIFSLASLTS